MGFIKNNLTYHSRMELDLQSSTKVSENKQKRIKSPKFLNFLEYSPDYPFK
jgi:hypothetical protein